MKGSGDLIVLGIDPGLNNVGYGVIEYSEATGLINILDYGVYILNASQERSEKLDTIYETTNTIMEKYDIDMLGMELAYHNPRMPNGAFAVREAIGVIRVVSHKHKIPLLTYTPQQIKICVSGKGNASKLEVGESISQILNINEYRFERKLRGKIVEEVFDIEGLIVKKYDHITDALSISYKTLLDTIELEKAE